MGVGIWLLKRAFKQKIPACRDEIAFAVPPCFPSRRWAAHGGDNGSDRLQLKEITAATLREEGQVSEV